MIKAILTDVDGVMTDGTVFIGESADEVRAFNIKDGMGIVLARCAGLKVAFLSARFSIALATRAKELGVEEVFVNAVDKVPVLEEFMKRHRLKKEEVAYIGDDLNDIPPMKKVGFPCAVADAVDEVKSVAKHVTTRGGGKGAVREIIDMILKAEGLFEDAFETYMKERRAKA